jgi:outer membrane immunogenic protein
MARKLSLLTSTALTTSTALISGAAMAADLRMPVKAPAAPAPFSWTGCYIGGNVGGASADIHQRISVPPPVATITESSSREIGIVAGGQAGCNWQHSRNWVFGIEGDINYLGIRRSRSLAFGLSGEDFIGSQVTRLQWLGTLRGRLGPTWGRSFIYVTGGLAAGEVRSSVSAVTTGGTFVFAGSNSETRAGWTVGAGWEHAFSDRVSAKLEYLHFDLGTASHAVVVTAGGGGLPSPWTASSRVRGDIVRIGVNFKLNP